MLAIARKVTLHEFVHCAVEMTGKENFVHSQKFMRVFETLSMHWKHQVSFALPWLLFSLLNDPMLGLPGAPQQGHWHEERCRARTEFVREAHGQLQGAINRSFNKKYHMMFKTPNRSRRNHSGSRRMILGNRGATEMVTGRRGLRLRRRSCPARRLWGGPRGCGTTRRGTGAAGA